MNQATAHRAVAFKRSATEQERIVYYEKQF